MPFFIKIYKKKEEKIMKRQAKVIAITNQKGGVGKTTTTLNLGVGLAEHGKKVLMIDADAQGSLTLSCGIKNPDELNFTLANVFSNIINDLPFDENEGIIETEGVDLMPGNILLSATEVSLVNAMSRETILRQYVYRQLRNYDYILIDCMPSLGMLTINALAAADKVIIPTQANYLSAKGLELLMSTIGRVKRQINPGLTIEGILITMVDGRTNLAKNVSKLLRDGYGQKIKIFNTEIPHSVKAQETVTEGKSIYKYAKSSKVAVAYRQLTSEIEEA